MKAQSGFCIGVCCLLLISVSSLAQGIDSLQIVDTKLGKGVQDREIVDETGSFMVNEKVYLWLKVANGTGDTLTVVWRHDGHEFSSTVGIGGSPWRAWTYKTAAWSGNWTVSVMDSWGQTLKEMNFTVAAPQDK